MLDIPGEAHDQKCRIPPYWRRSKVDRGASSRECQARAELDTVSLLWTHGRAYSQARLEHRLKCPHCGSRHVKVSVEDPGTAGYVYRRYELAGAALRAAEVARRRTLRTVPGPDTVLEPRWPRDNFRARRGGPSAGRRLPASISVK
jgi:hypothetical protein